MLKHLTVPSNTDSQTCLHFAACVIFENTDWDTKIGFNVSAAQAMQDACRPAAVCMLKLYLPSETSPSLVYRRYESTSHAFAIVIRATVR